MKPLTIEVKGPFDFKHSLSYLSRSSDEILHRCTYNSVTKLIFIDQRELLIRVSAQRKNELYLELLTGDIQSGDEDRIVAFVKEWFDLETDLQLFYRHVSNDPYLKNMVESYHGYRMVRTPDFFESMVWAITGQQVNLTFAHRIKRSLIEQYGPSVEHKGVRYYAFPKPNQLQELRQEELIAIKYSRQKASYIIGLIDLLNNNKIQLNLLKGGYHEAKGALLAIKGVGEWTANYVLMKSYGYNEALPLGDSGLSAAIRHALRLDRKPTSVETIKFFEAYRGWEAYATLYLWKSL